MSTELPDFQSAPAWMDFDGDLWSPSHIRQNIEFFGDTRALAKFTPWTPLDTAEEWVKRIDRDQLAEVIGGVRALAAACAFGVPDDVSPTDVGRYIADAVIAALPELMKGEE